MVNNHSTTPDIHTQNLSTPSPTEEVPSNMTTNPSGYPKKTRIDLWIKISIALLTLILLGTSFYFLYWIRTPEYSLNLIRTSVKQQDVTTFQKHVDLDTLLSHSFDSLVEAQIELDPKINAQLVKGMAFFAKPIATTALKGYILNEIGTSKLERKATEPTDKKSNEQVVNDFSEKSGFASLEFKGFGSTKTDGDIALVEIKLFDKELKKDFTLLLKMAKLDEGTWRLIKIENLKQHLVEYSKAQKSKE